MNHGFAPFSFSQSRCNGRRLWVTATWVCGLLQLHGGFVMVQGQQPERFGFGRGLQQYHYTNNRRVSASIYRGHMAEILEAKNKREHAWEDNIHNYRGE